MYRKCYTITKAHKYGYDIALKFRSIFNGKFYHSVPIVTFSFGYEKINENEFLKHYPTPDLLTCTADKLRWYRLKNSYTQKDIAEMIGVHRSTYIHYEDACHKFYYLDKLQLLADIYKVDITCLLDDYMIFMYKGQGRQIKALRKALALTQYQLANMFNTHKQCKSLGAREKFYAI